ncbi:hypothetical protein [Kitasatospora sp. NPDC093558]|uniref:hypothetical protein n=1 Tax=Kitasatospora sp. NPDC093558 TaxID=3155201 RepID=UPI0034288F38
MQRIEFLTYPADDASSNLLWGIRIDGVDLRVHAAEATRDLWRREYMDGSPSELERLLLTQHDGLPVEEVADAGRHFLGDPAPQFTGAGAGPCSTAVLGCSCGLWGCWPLLTTITITPETVTWSAFRQPFRKEWGELPMGPYVFARPAYEAALTAPTRLTGDPLELDGEHAP